MTNLGVGRGEGSQQKPLLGKGMDIFWATSITITKLLLKQINIYMYHPNSNEYYSLQIIMSRKLSSHTW